jgi:hypothetical protein
MMVKKSIEEFATINTEILIVSLQATILLGPPFIVCITFFISRMIDIEVDDGIDTRRVSCHMTE